MQEDINRLIAVLAISGAILLFVGTYFHPRNANPMMPLEAFAEYAGDRHWILSHLLQLLGALLMLRAGLGNLHRAISGVSA
jgi:hypothetical protein